ncbi:DUF3106 domain-containing protein [Cupriavidus sp. WKF15]|uniref:DUF3106 domain-containing protein n=1 Tax=Cupriavidus sp. WKF15 TaxID=3032282 RepID=UPI0023E2AE46|nr:DUF3106 domain-containing protein [Cupriavidus sp. WKF15]WER44902.1 DUF3106 domain-containing protein [Cupriavidus sp. WKF15]
MARATSHSDATRRRLEALLLSGFFAAAIWCLTPPPAHAQGPASAPQATHAVNAHPTWSELTPVQQRILGPLQPLWDTMPELNRRKWLRIAERYPKFSPEEQTRLQTRMAEWVKMTPQQHRLARENYQITRALPAEKKAEAWDKYQQLPEEQKKKLAEAERVPRRPGAVSALPSGKRLPSDTSRQIHQDKKPAALTARPASSAAAKGAAADASVAAPAATPPANTPASPTPPAAPEGGSEAAAATQADGTIRQ